MIVFSWTDWRRDEQIFTWHSPKWPSGKGQPCTPQIPGGTRLSSGSSGSSPSSAGLMG